MCSAFLFLLARLIRLLSRPDSDLSSPRHARAASSPPPGVLTCYPSSQALKKKKKPAHLAAAIFEKRVQDTRENEDKARAAELEAKEEARQEDLQPVEPVRQVLLPRPSPCSSTPFLDHSSPPPSNSSQKLPEGWAAAWDEASGAFYYYHTVKDGSDVGGRN